MGTYRFGKGLLCSAILDAVLLPVALVGQNALKGPELRAGLQVYGRTCANQYCHGANGTAGKAPALAGRGFDQAYVMKVTREGKPNTAMVGLEEVLTSAELEAVVTYVVSLQESANGGSQRELDPNRPWLGHSGRELFFDLARIAPCGSCHNFDGLGIAIAAPIQGPLPANATALRRLDAGRVRTVAHPSAGSFPGLIVSGDSGPIRAFDFSAQLPVLRTLNRDQATVREASGWNHSGHAESYSDVELDAILAFLKTALQASSN